MPFTRMAIQSNFVKPKLKEKSAQESTRGQVRGTYRDLVGQFSRYG